VGGNDFLKGRVEKHQSTPVMEPFFRRGFRRQPPKHKKAI
jgi:hypothetical protein